MTDPRQPFPDAARDFDFLHGSWRVRHRRRAQWLAGNEDWTEFDGTCVCQPMLGGLGNVDDNWLELPGGAYRAVTLRAFDPGAGRWSIWWLDSRHPAQLDVPVVGGFDDGIGRFFADDLYGGRPIRIRFLWSAITGTSAEWRQAFSLDGGATWETNWEMRFTRAT
ncbi:MAG TPA: DUF1579 domain-containing protein [Allosphingosinicella sp.]|nr:DUF1579 domain-containing protein [Allosphingosinicella sp.]